MTRYQARQSANLSTDLPAEVAAAQRYDQPDQASRFRISVQLNHEALYDAQVSIRLCNITYSSIRAWCSSNHAELGVTCRAPVLGRFSAAGIYKRQAGIPTRPALVQPSFETERTATRQVHAVPERKSSSASCGHCTSVDSDTTPPVAGDFTQRRLSPCGDCPGSIDLAAAQPPIRSNRWCRCNP